MVSLFLRKVKKNNGDLYYLDSSFFLYGSLPPVRKEIVY